MINRRDFIHYSGIVGAAVLVGVAAREYALRNSTDSDALRILDTLLNHLFNDSDGYVTSHLNVKGYFQAVFADTRIDEEERTFLVNGTRWLQESAEERFDKGFLALQASQRETLLNEISMLRWGDRWLYKVMGYYFEVVFSDPIYGGNINANGWKWLDYHPGFPRPNEVAI